MTHDPSARFVCNNTLTRIYTSVPLNKVSSLKTRVSSFKLNKQKISNTPTFNTRNLRLELWQPSAYEYTQRPEKNSINSQNYKSRQHWLARCCCNCASLQVSSTLRQTHFLADRTNGRAIGRLQCSVCLSVVCRLSVVVCNVMYCG